MGLTIVTPASSGTWPVTLADIKAVCRIEDTSFDTELDLIWKAAFDHIQAAIGRPLAPTVYKLSLDEFSDAIELPKGPVTAVASVKYYDEAAVLQTLDPAYYTLDLASKPEWIVRNSGYDWPALLDAVNVVEVTFTAGFTASLIPAGIKAAFLGLAKHWFENGMDAGVPATLEPLLFPNRDHGF